MAASVVLRPAVADDSGPDNIARVTAHFTPAGAVEMRVRNHTLVAEQAGGLVGTAAIGATDAADVMALRTFFVDLDVQRLGIESLLPQALVTDAGQRGSKMISVRSSIAGQPFYAAQGFVKICNHWGGDERTIEMHRMP